MENCFSVIKVERCYNKHVNAYQKGNSVKIFSSAHENCFVKVPATLKITESQVNGETLYKSELAFVCKEELPQTGTRKNYSYKITISNGRQFLMGVGITSRPCPVETKTRTMGDVTSNQMWSYKVTWEDTSPLPIII